MKRMHMYDNHAIRSSFTLEQVGDVEGLIALFVL